MITTFKTTGTLIPVITPLDILASAAVIVQENQVNHTTTNPFDKEGLKRGLNDSLRTNVDNINSTCADEKHNFRQEIPFTLTTCNETLSSSFPASPLSTTVTTSTSTKPWTLSTSFRTLNESYNTYSLPYSSQSSNKYYNENKNDATNFSSHKRALPSSPPIQNLRTISISPFLENVTRNINDSQIGFNRGPDNRDNVSHINGSLRKLDSNGVRKIHSAISFIPPVSQPEPLQSNLDSQNTRIGALLNQDSAPTMFDSNQSLNPLVPRTEDDREYGLTSRKPILSLKTVPMKQYMNGSTMTSFPNPATMEIHEEKQLFNSSVEHLSNKAKFRSQSSNSFTSHIHTPIFTAAQDNFSIQATANESLPSLPRLTANFNGEDHRRLSTLPGIGCAKTDPSNENNSKNFIRPTMRLTPSSSVISLDDNVSDDGRFNYTDRNHKKYIADLEYKYSFIVRDKKERLDLDAKGHVHNESNLYNQQYYETAISKGSEYASKTSILPSPKPSIYRPLLPKPSKQSGVSASQTPSQDASFDSNPSVNPSYFVDLQCTLNDFRNLKQLPSNFHSKRSKSVISHYDAAEYSDTNSATFHRKESSNLQSISRHNHKAVQLPGNFENHSTELSSPNFHDKQSLKGLSPPTPIMKKPRSRGRPRIYERPVRIGSPKKCIDPKILLSSIIN